MSYLVEDDRLIGLKAKKGSEEGEMAIADVTPEVVDGKLVDPDVQLCIAVICRAIIAKVILLREHVSDADGSSTTVIMNSSHSLSGQIAGTAVLHARVSGEEVGFDLRAPSKNNVRSFRGNCLWSEIKRWFDIDEGLPLPDVNGEDLFDNLSSNE